MTITKVNQGKVTASMIKKKLSTLKALTLGSSNPVILICPLGQAKLAKNSGGPFYLLTTAMLHPPKLDISCIPQNMN